MATLDPKQTCIAARLYLSPSRGKKIYATTVSEQRVGKLGASHEIYLTLQTQQPFDGVLYDEVDADELLDYQVMALNLQDLRKS